jgi:hypothetical protein
MFEHKQNKGGPTTGQNDDASAECHSWNRIVEFRDAGAEIDVRETEDALQVPLSPTVCCGWSCPRPIMVAPGA